MDAIAPKKNMVSSRISKIPTNVRSHSFIPAARSVRPDTSITVKYLKVVKKYEIRATVNTIQFLCGLK